MSVSMTLAGDRELLAAFGELDKNVQGKVARKAVGAGAKLVNKAMKRRAKRIGAGDIGSRDSSGRFTRALAGGEIAKAIGVKRKSRKGRAFAAIGPRVDYPGKEEGVEPFRLAHFFEFGTAERYHKDGKFVGAHPMTPFMRPAWADVKDATETAILGEVRSGIEEAAK